MTTSRWRWWSTRPDSPASTTRCTHRNCSSRSSRPAPDPATRCLILSPAPAPRSSWPIASAATASAVTSTPSTPNSRSIGCATTPPCSWIYWHERRGQQTTDGGRKSRARSPQGTDHLPRPTQIRLTFAAQQHLSPETALSLQEFPPVTTHKYPMPATPAFEYCNGAAHYRRCPHNPPYRASGADYSCACHSWHVWFGRSPALTGASVGTCPNFTGDYSAPRLRCKVSSWEHTADAAPCDGPVIMSPDRTHDDCDP